MTFDRQPVLVGELVGLRPLQEDDFPALFAIASDPLLWEQHPSRDRSQEVVFRAWFDKALASGGALVVTDRLDGAIIGTSRFDRHDPGRHQIEIGWTFLARSHWGGAYNGEMKRLMLEYAARFVEHVVFRAHAQNARSQRALEKLGAVRVGTEPDERGWGDNVVFRVEVSQWASP